MQIRYKTLQGGSFGYWLLLGVLSLLVLCGFLAARYMEHEGHWVTGMDNQIVWGTPHVFAVFLIVAASGALNIASLASVFGRSAYKPLGRLSGLLAITLLLGGLVVLVLDLGRPDRLIVAMTYYNFKSIFAWNIFLYTGFLFVVGIYLWMMFEPRMNVHSKRLGMIALVWRIALTTGTGSIFGFLVARQGYDAAIMAPMFIIMSLSFGTAIFILTLVAAGSWSRLPLNKDLVGRLTKLLGIFVSAVLYITLVYHITNLYAREHNGFEKFILLDGGVYSILFWFGQIGIGGVAPLVLLFWGIKHSIRLTVLTSVLVVLGGLAQIYVIIIGGQAYPLVIFPGMKVSSGFFDGVVNHYTPSAAEVFLGLGGLGLAFLVTVGAMRVLPFLPERLDVGRSE